MTFDNYMKRILDEDSELLKSLGSDYDEEGIPYWKKWGTEKKFDNEYPIDKSSH